MDVLDKNVGILHSYDSRALEFVVFEIEMKFTAALALSLIFPIDSPTSLSSKGNGNHCSFAKWFRLEAVNDIGNLVWHLRCTMRVERTIK